MPISNIQRLEFEKNKNVSLTSNSNQFKMKNFLTITILTLIGQFSLAQEQSSWTDIDTIEQFTNKTFVEYKVFSDSILKEQAQGFLYPIVKEHPKYRILRKLITTEVEIDSIVFHGNKTTYLESGEFKTEKFENGELLSTNYFNSKGEPISEREFTDLNNVRGPCGLPIGHYLYRKKKKS